MSDNHQEEAEERAQPVTVLLSARVVLHIDGRVEVITDPDNEVVYSPVLGKHPPLNQLMMTMSAAASDLMVHASAQASVQLQLQTAQSIQSQLETQQMASKLQVPRSR